MNMNWAFVVIFSTAIMAACGDNSEKQADENQQNNTELVNNDPDDPGLIPDEQRAPIELDREGDVDLQSVEVQSISPRDAHAKIKSDNLHIVDVRSAQDFNQQHIPKSENFDFSSIRFMRQVGNLSKDLPVLLYCKDGRLSPDAAKLAGTEGFPEVYVLRGGLDNWVQEELPVE